MHVLSFVLTERIDLWILQGEIGSLLNSWPGGFSKHVHLFCPQLCLVCLCYSYRTALSSNKYLKAKKYDNGPWIININI